MDGALHAHLAPRLAGVDAAELPRAGDVARLAAQAWTRGERVAPERVEPAYLRDNVALTLEEQRARRDARCNRIRAGCGAAQPSTSAPAGRNCQVRVTWRMSISSSVRGRGG